MSGQTAGWAERFGQRVVDRAQAMRKKPDSSEIGLTVFGVANAVLGLILWWRLS